MVLSFHLVVFGSLVVRYTTISDGSRTARSRRRHARERTRGAAGLPPAAQLGRRTALARRPHARSRHREPDQEDGGRQRDHALHEGQQVVPAVWLLEHCGADLEFTQRSV